MPCYLPLDAYHAPGGISFTHRDSFGIPIQLPCGRCLGCRLEKAKEWALRCYHENLIIEEQGGKSCFVTLTYSPENLPADHGLHHADFKNFLRRLKRKSGKRIRYFMSGEYGKPTEKNNYIARPHFHAILFGYRPKDLKLVNIRNGSRNYISKELGSCWEFGSHEIGYVTFKNAGYVARYTLKKQKEDGNFIDPETGEILYEKVRAPYIRMSLRPGIGARWFRKYKDDLFPHDYAVLPDGRQTPVPRYYRQLLEAEYPDLADELRKARVEKARANPDNTPERLAVRHKIRQEKARKLVRSL